MSDSSSSMDLEDVPVLPGSPPAPPSGTVAALYAPGGLLAPSNEGSPDPSGRTAIDFSIKGRAHAPTQLAWLDVRQQRLHPER